MYGVYKVIVDSGEFVGDGFFIVDSFIVNGVCNLIVGLGNLIIW